MSPAEQKELFLHRVLQTVVEEYSLLTKVVKTDQQMMKMCNSFSARGFSQSFPDTEWSEIVHRSAGVIS